jgi:hypothetical protein
LWTLFLLRMILIYPQWGAPVPLFFLPLAALASSALWYTALHCANRGAGIASA